MFPRHVIVNVDFFCWTVTFLFGFFCKFVFYFLRKTIKSLSVFPSPVIIPTSSQRLPWCQRWWYHYFKHHTGRNSEIQPAYFAIFIAANCCPPVWGAVSFFSFLFTEDEVGRLPWNLPTGSGSRLLSSTFCPFLFSSDSFWLLAQMGCLAQTHHFWPFPALLPASPCTSSAASFVLTVQPQIGPTYLTAHRGRWPLGSAPWSCHLHRLTQESKHWLTTQTQGHSGQVGKVAFWRCCLPPPFAIVINCMQM